MQERKKRIILLYSIVSINILIWKKIENTYIERRKAILYKNEKRKAIYRKIENKIYTKSKRYINRAIIEWIFDLN